MKLNSCQQALLLLPLGYDYIRYVRSLAYMNNECELIIYFVFDCVTDLLDCLSAVYLTHELTSKLYA